MDATEFLGALFELKDDNHYISMYTPGAAHHVRFKHYEDAAEWALKHPANPYFGCGLAGEEFGKHLKENIVAIPGLWVDIDVLNDKAHKTDNLPPSIKAALELVCGYGMDPTIVINSGHGIHAWWLFEKPWSFDSDTERAEAETLVMRLQNTIQQRVYDKGKTWKIDSTANVNRILRPPGTINKKKDCPPVKTKLVSFDESNAYNPDDFYEILVTGSPVPPKGSNVESGANFAGSGTPNEPIAPEEIKGKLGELVWDRNAEAPKQKFMELMNLDHPRFYQTWNEKRGKDNKEFPLKDISSSGYDFAIAIATASANWTDQEILDALIERRRTMGHDLHFDRKRRYVTTIVNARKRIEGERAKEEAHKAAALVATPYVEIEKNRKAICDYFAFKSLRIKKFEGDTPVYWLEVDGQCVEFTNPDILMLFGRFRREVFKLIDRKIKAKKKDWDDGLDDLVSSIIEKIAPDDEAQRAGKMKLWIGKYLSKKTSLTAAEGAPNRSPFIHNDDWYFYLEGFEKYIGGAWNNTRTSQEVSRVLSGGLGLSKKTIAYTNDQTGTRTSTKTWRVPQSKHADFGISAPVNRSGKVIPIKSIG